ncbi:heterokaryon incompatibility protein-domain-containing protein [Podospora didyma]|uniref:Heterokaryon incompatibility protein-domain-containing protein n=1 Tax=Podospora didyma TaxID=330526 RepID=A0AAE0U232_9PEZI|nr:heterokaryon incompatibility protein-domain-containing protein [Podospora didyma]
MPCPLCHELDGSPPGEQHKATFQLSDISEYAKKCPACTFLLSVVSGANLDAINSISLQLNEKGDHHSLQISCQTASKRAQVVEIHFSPAVDVTPEQLELAKRCSRNKFDVEHSPYTDSSDSFAWAEGKVKDCTEHPDYPHVHCISSQSATLPDRILDLGTDNDSISLHEASSPSPQGSEAAKYATLSHCWGGYLPIRLIKSNLSEFRHNIKWHLLPKTFQDAVAFARRLGFRYLWIDSLCIVQDDADDWAKQSAKMAGIYENSTITLAATVAADGRDGLFTPPRESLAGYVTVGAPFKVKLGEITWDELSKLGAGYYLVKEWPSDNRKHPGYFFHYGADNALAGNAALLGRGWVYQERVLSRRVLHFGHSELLWECNQGVSCQCGNWRHSGSRHPGAQFPKLQHAQSLNGSNFQSLPESMEGYMFGLRYRWQRIVSEFSALSITFESDRIPAVAGIAKQFLTRLPPGSLNFVLGVWKEFLFEHLLWQPAYWTTSDSTRWLSAQPGDPAARPPSWTWASVGGAVQYPMEDPSMNAPASPQATDRDPKIAQIPWSDSETDRLLGRVTGDLILLGHLTKTRLRRYVMKDTAEVSHGVSRYDGTSFYTATLDIAPPPTSSSTSARWIDVEPIWPEPPAEMGTRPSPYYSGLAPPEDPVDVAIMEYQNCLMPIMRERFVSCQELDEAVWCLFIKFWNGHAGKSMFLLLKQVAESPRKQYTRVGLVSYPPMRLPMFDPKDMAMQEVILV